MCIGFAIINESVSALVWRVFANGEILDNPAGLSEAPAVRTARARFPASAASSQRLDDLGLVGPQPAVLIATTYGDSIAWWPDNGRGRGRVSSRRRKNRRGDR
jgi:hypothetical protein